ncbi:MAG: molybdopterin dinucleotide binding domain-containing protein, partial [Acidobacteriota bacterium]
LPPSAPLEHSHYDLIFNNLAVRNVAKWSEPVFPKPDGALDDWQIFAELEKRLGKQTFRAKLDRFASRRLGPEGYVDQGLKRGPYRLSLQKLKAATHGLDLGALEPCLPERLMTPDKRLHLAPPPLVNDARRLDSLLGEPASQNGHLRLIGRRHVRSNNSWMHNAPRLMRGAERCTLLIHPDDAAARGIREGGKVKVRSDVGEVTVAAEPSDEVMPGVVSLPHGWGHGRDGVTLTVANANPGVSVNDLIDDQEVDPLCGNAAVNGVLVEVEPSW